MNVIGQEFFCGHSANIPGLMTGQSGLKKKTLLKTNEENDEGGVILFFFLLKKILLEVWLFILSQTF